MKGFVHELFPGDEGLVVDRLAVLSDDGLLLAALLDDALLDLAHEDRPRVEAKVRGYYLYRKRTQKTGGGVRPSSLVTVRFKSHHQLPL